MNDIVPIINVAKELNITLEELDNLSDIGTLPTLDWIDVNQLQIDFSFQRKVLRTGFRNIKKIVTNFDWKRFGAIQVAYTDDNRYIIIDGQHRTIAAFIRGIKSVPCNIVKATHKEQALAFVSINSNITTVSGLIVFKAQVAAGEEDAIRIVNVCKKAGVYIAPYPIDSISIKPRYTIALGAVRNCLKTYGEEHLIFALRCIVDTKPDNNRGLLREAAIKAYCHVFDLNPDIKNESVFKYLEFFDLAKAIEDAAIDARKKRKVYQSLSVIIIEYFEKVGIL